MRPEIKSITLFIRESHFERFCRGDYEGVKWTLTKGDPAGGYGPFSHRQVQVQVSMDTYQNMVDARVVDDIKHTPPF